MSNCDHAPTVSQLRCPCGQFTVDAQVAWPQQVVDLEAENARLRRKLEEIRTVRDSSVLDMGVLDRILEGGNDE